jgi:hypothetical protein
MAATACRCTTTPDHLLDQGGLEFSSVHRHR